MGHSYREIFESNLDLIKRLAIRACHRNRLREDEAEDFQSSTMIKLMEEDFSVLRKYQGRASLAAYLATVINAHFLNYRDRQWGKWRPSTVAQRLGLDAVLLEQLMNRDEHSFPEAVQIMRTNNRVGLSEREIANLAEQLPVRLPRKFEGGEKITYLEAKSSDLAGSLAGKQAAPLQKRIGEVLARALSSLVAEDRSLLRLHFLEGLSVAAIARSYDKNQRRLYRRINKLTNQLRLSLEREGIFGKDLLAVYGNEDFLHHPAIDLESIFSRLSP